MLDYIAHVRGDVDSQLQLGYMAATLLAFWVICLRRARPGKRPNLVRNLDVETGLPAPVNPPKDKALQMNMRLDRYLEGPGTGAVLHLLVILGTALAGLIGWRIPAEIERIYGDGAGFGLIFPNVEMPGTGRLAQVVGVVCFALIALRLLRLIIPMMAFVVLGGLAVLAADYVLDAGWIIP